MLLFVLSFFASIRRVPKPLLALTALVVVAAVAGPLWLSDDGSFSGLEELERAQRSGEEVSTRSDSIRKSLKEIAGNLEAGAGISEKGDEISDLTSRQQDSLRELVEVLETQLEVLDRSSSLVGETTESTESLADISEEQAATLDEAVSVLRNIEDLAARAGARSADMTAQARYGARLAEDSKDAFRP